MKFLNSIGFKRIVITAVCLFLICFIKVEGQEAPRYIFVNSAPGNHFRVGRPSTFTRSLFDEIAEKIAAPVNPKMWLGISFIFDYLAADLDSVEKSLDRFMALSATTKVPVLIHLDGLNWMQARPDLWNWWDPKKPGFNPENKRNVEWSGWNEQSAIKISWRNWGKQGRIPPAPNLASPAVVKAQIDALTRLVPRIIGWYRSLPADQKYLLGAVKLGHETSIGVNAYYYKEGNRYLELLPGRDNLDPLESYNTEAGFSGGVAQIGYAAVKTAGIKSRGRITAHDMEEVIYRYLDTLCKTAFRLGLPKELIYTHQGGTFPPWEKHLSYRPANNEHSLPGWSLYSTNPHTAGDLGDVVDSRPQEGWAAAEWWWPGENKNEWISHLHTTLTYKNCRYLAIFNWENSLEKDRSGIEAIRELIAGWKK